MSQFNEIKTCNKPARNPLLPVSLKLLLDHKKAVARVEEIADKKIRSAAIKHYGFNSENS